MVFTLRHLKQFIFSIKNKNIHQINIKTDQTNIVINKRQIENKINTYNYISPNYYSSNQNSEYDNYSKPNSHNLLNKSNLIKDESDIYSTIISPMVGTFYRSPAPNEPAFIEKNDIVEKKQTVCIIEAMKLMNEIESEVNGEIIEILVNDGDIVDCGQPLMKVKGK